MAAAGQFAMTAVSRRWTEVCAAADVVLGGSDDQAMNVLSQRLESGMPQIEYVTVANHAEAINGLLYLQGAGWTDIQQPQGPQGPGVVHFGIGASILVGWNETNRRYPLILQVIHEDGTVLMNIDAQVEAGRPPGLPPGSDLRSVLAVGAEANFPKSGGYELRAEIDGQVRTASFRVHQAQPPPTAATGPADFRMPPGQQ